MRWIRRFLQLVTRFLSPKVPESQPMGSPLIVPVFQFPAAAGVNTSGYKVNTYAAGTSTPLATYTDSTLGVGNANPVVMNANGEANIWLGTSLYKFVGTDASNNILWTVDNVSQSGLGGSVLGASGGNGEWLQFGAFGTASTPVFVNATQCQIGAVDLTATPYFLTIGTRLKFSASSTLYATIIGFPSAGNVTVVVDAGGVLDATITGNPVFYGFPTSATNTAIYRQSKVIAQAGGNVTITPTVTLVKLGGAPTELVDYLSEFVTDTFTAKVAGTYRVWGNVLMNEGAATTGIQNGACAVAIRKNAVANITKTINWIPAASIASTQDVAFNGTLALAVNDTVDIAVSMTFTGTAPTAALASLNIERVL